MTEKCLGNILPLDSTSIISNPDIGDAAASDFDRHTAGSRIDCIFQQLLHDGRRTFNYLTRSDQFCDLFFQNIDFGHTAHLLSFCYSFNSPLSSNSLFIASMGVSVFRSITRRRSSTSDGTTAAKES